MMKRIVLAVAIAALGVTAVVAQSDPIAARKALMKENGNQSRIAREMIEGKQPFDLAKAKAVSANFAEPRRTRARTCCRTIPRAATPRRCRRSGRTRPTSTPSWSSSAPTPRPRDAKVKDLDSFKAAMAEVGKNCGGCHNTYRKKAS